MKTENKKQVSENKANALSEKFSFAEVMKKAKESTQGLLKTSLGRSETNIYKKQMFEGMNDKQIKSARKKLRNFGFSLLDGIVNDPKNERLINSFIDFYKHAYLINDFSFSSIASENTKETKKATLVKGLEIVKNFVNK